MNQVHVGIGEYKISNQKDDLIKTFALGSCVAVIIYDLTKKVAGLIHVALPDSSVSTDKAKRKPGYFVDTGLPLFLREMKKADAGLKNVRIKIAGGANIMDKERHFDIGKRNVLAVKKLLWKNRLGIIKEDTGGSVVRTVSISVATGEVKVTSGKNSWTL
jgi:chemotaxis protein CheD